MSKRRLTLAALLLAGSTAAQAEHWWILDRKDAAGHTWLADSDTLTPASTGATAEKLFWIHKYYPEARNGMKSAKIQILADCARHTIQQLKYIDYNIAYDIIDSGEMDPEIIAVQPNSNGQTMLEFACNDSAFRKANYLEINKGVNYRQVAEFFNDPKAVVEAPKASQ